MLRARNRNKSFDWVDPSIIVCWKYFIQSECLTVIEIIIKTAHNPVNSGKFCKNANYNFKYLFFCTEISACWTIHFIHYGKKNFGTDYWHDKLNTIWGIYLLWFLSWNLSTTNTFVLILLTRCAYTSRLLILF